MERAQAEAIYDQGKDLVVAVLLRMDEQIRRLESEDGEQRIERLLSAHTSCRLQRRSLHAYLIDGGRSSSWTIRQR